MMHDLLTKLGASSATDIIWLTVGLLGQLMFATVATHAALNSCIAWGDELSGSSLVICFELEHENKNRARHTIMTVGDNFRSMIYYI